MFKSVFAKYITVFMLIIVVSFAMILSITMTMVNNYAVSAKLETVMRATQATCYFIQNRINLIDDTSIPRYITDHTDDLSRFLVPISLSYDTEGEMTFFIVGAEGDVLLYYDKNDFAAPNGKVLSDSVMKTLEEGHPVSGFDNVGSFYRNTHLIYADGLFSETGELCGAVVTATAANALTELLSSLMKTIIVSSLWVMLAALIAVYFITEKIMNPIKPMSRAAKSFAAGKFDVRIPVSGQDEIAELATAMNQMAESLDNLEKMRNSFIANVSHDLRTPMTTIAGFIDNILAGAIPPEKHEYYLGVIKAEVLRLSRLVSGLLDLSRIQAGDRKFNSQPFDICEMARQILISFEQKIEEKHLDVEFDAVDDNVLVNADSDAIHQILYNLCDNAIKFSREGGKLRIILEESAQDKSKNKKIVVRVYNEGQGIPDEDKAFIFERFYKSDKSRGLDKNGVGLGLYIAKTIIDAHKEEIWVESEYGRYCEFGFTMPYASVK